MDDKGRTWQNRLLAALHDLTWAGWAQVAGYSGGVGGRMPQWDGGTDTPEAPAPVVEVPGLVVRVPAHVGWMGSEQVLIQGATFTRDGDTTTVVMDNGGSATGTLDEAWRWWVEDQSAGA